MQNEILNDLMDYIRREGNDRKLIGYFNHEFLPPELITAAGGMPLPLIFKGSEDKTAIGSSYLTPSMCPFALSQLGSFENQNQGQDPTVEVYKQIDAIISTTYCTANTLVTEWIGDQFSIPVFNLYIPYLQREHHIALYTRQLKTLYNKLCAFTNTQPEPESICTQIGNYQRFYSRVRSVLDSERKNNRRLDLVHRATLFGPAGSDYVGLPTEKVNAKVQLDGNGSVPLMLTGASVFIGDPLYTYIDEADGQIIYDNTWLYQPFWNANGMKVDFEASGKDPFDYFAEMYRDRNSSPHVSAENNQVKALVDDIYNIAQKYKIKGIINHILKFCDITGHHRQYFKTALSRRGIPVLNLERDYSSGMRGQLRTRIEAFIEMIS